MGKKRNKLINPTPQQKVGRLNLNVADSDIAEATGNDKSVLVCVNHLYYKYECFSKWTDAEMNKFWSFKEKLRESTWQDVYNSASKGEEKRGFAYTLIPKAKYEHFAFVSQLSPEINMFELRVEDKMRVHGFRLKSVFHLCLLDREHKITN